MHFIITTQPSRTCADLHHSNTQHEQNTATEPQHKTQTQHGGFRTHQEAEKYNATSFFPPKAEAVGTPVVLGFVSTFGPKRERDQCWGCVGAMVVDVDSRSFVCYDHLFSIFYYK